MLLPTSLSDKDLTVKFKPQSKYQIERYTLYNKQVTNYKRS